MDPLETIALNGPEKFTYVNTLLSSKEKKQLQHILLGNAYVLALSHSDMVGIDSTLASHKLNIIASAKAVKHHRLSETYYKEDKEFSPRSSSDYSDTGRQSFESRFY